MSIVMQPRVIIVYRHPMFELLVQQGIIPVLHAGSSVVQECDGMRPNAMRLAATTPIGWKVLRAARRYRRLLGRNSSVIKASMGILPPTPSPIIAVMKQIPPKFDGARI